MGAVKSYLNDHDVTISNFAVTPQNLAGLIKLIDAGVINNSVASHKLFPAMIKEPGKKPMIWLKNLTC
jgi:aspartyl-tRNA(Asn)/glutamyl-tRNA(Gln) amidotransferase subunit B